MPRCSISGKLEEPNRLLTFHPTRFFPTTIYVSHDFINNKNSTSPSIGSSGSSGSSLTPLQPPPPVVSRTALLNLNLLHVHFPLIIPSMEAIELALTTTRSCKGLLKNIRLIDDYYLLEEIQHAVERTEPMITSLKRASEDLAARRVAEERTKEEQKRLEATTTSTSNTSGKGRTRKKGSSKGSKRGSSSSSSSSAAAAASEANAAMEPAPEENPITFLRSLKRGDVRYFFYFCFPRFGGSPVETILFDPFF